MLGLTPWCFSMASWRKSNLQRHLENKMDAKSAFKITNKPPKNNQTFPASVLFKMDIAEFCSSFPVHVLFSLYSKSQPRDAGSKATSKFSDRLSCAASQSTDPKGTKGNTENTLEACQALEWVNYVFYWFLMASCLQNSQKSSPQKLPTCCQVVTNFRGGSNTSEADGIRMPCIKQMTLPMYLGAGA